MRKKIELSRDKSIVFMGTMNAMPMMYAMELRKLGYEVIYFVDVSKKEQLSRPENHFPEISYPYPSWIVETILPSQLLLTLFPRLFSIFFQRKIKKVTSKEVGCFFLNGFFSSLAAFLKKGSSKIILSHGSDLDVWAYKNGAKALASSFAKRSFFRYLPIRISGFLIKKIIDNQYSGMAHSDAVFYFPQGFNAAGDEVITNLSKAGINYIPRYDISFEPLLQQSREYKSQSGAMEIFSGVRFTFKTFPDGNAGYGKGNDVIIEGIAKFHKIYKNIRVNFVDKGEDVELAKKMCHTLGLDEVVNWHKEMSFKELLGLYMSSDICFDQVGAHWVGAIGGSALWLGKPLIANPEAAIKHGIWPENNPICSAKSSDEICNWLIRLQDEVFRKKISDESKDFVEKNMGPVSAIERTFDFI